MMHRNIRTVHTSYRLHHPGIVTGCNIIENQFIRILPTTQGDIGPKGIDGQWELAKMRSPKRQGRLQARPFLFGRHGLRAGAGGTGPQIDDIRPLRQGCFHAGNEIGGVKATVRSQQAAVRKERIRRQVEDGHYLFHSSGKKWVQNNGFLLTFANRNFRPAIETD